MPAHLRPLPKCLTCGKPATTELYNGANARSGTYCSRCGPRALKEFKARYED